MFKCQQTNTGSLQLACDGFKFQIMLQTTHFCTTWWEMKISIPLHSQETQSWETEQQQLGGKGWSCVEAREESQDFHLGLMMICDFICKQLILDPIITSLNVYH